MKYVAPSKNVSAIWITNDLLEQYFSKFASRCPETKIPKSKFIRHQQRSYSSSTKHLRKPVAQFSRDFENSSSLFSPQSSGFANLDIRWNDDNTYLPPIPWKPTSFPQQPLTSIPHQVNPATSSTLYKDKLSGPPVSSSHGIGLSVKLWKQCDKARNEELSNPRSRAVLKMIKSVSQQTYQERWAQILSMARILQELGHKLDEQCVMMVEKASNILDMRQHAVMLVQKLLADESADVVSMDIRVWSAVDVATHLKHFILVFEHLVLYRHYNQALQVLRLVSSEFSVNHYLYAPVCRLLHTMPHQPQHLSKTGKAAAKFTPEAMEFISSIIQLLIDRAGPAYLELHWRVIDYHLRVNETAAALDYYTRLVKVLSKDHQRQFLVDPIRTIRFFNHLASRKLFREAMVVYNLMPKSTKPDHATALFRALVKNKAGDKHIRAFWSKNLDAQEVRTTDVYNTYLLHLARSRDVEDIRLVLAEMKDADVPMNGPTVVAILNSLANLGERGTLSEFIDDEDISNVLEPELRQSIMVSTVQTWNNTSTLEWKKTMLMAALQQSQRRAGTAKVAKEADASHVNWSTVNIMLRMFLFSDKLPHQCGPADVGQLYEFMLRESHLGRPERSENTKLDKDQQERLWAARAGYKMFKKSFIVRGNTSMARQVVKDWKSWKAVWDIDRWHPRASSL